MSTPIQRQDVIDYIQRTLPESATLPMIIEALSKLQLERTPDYDREWLDELTDELAPDKLIHGVRLPAVPSREEILQLLAAPDNLRDALIFRVFYATGVRVSELTGLLWADIRYSDQTIFVRSGKYDIDRYVLADPRTFELLQQLQAGQDLSERVFPLSVTRIQELVKIYASQIGLLQKYEALDRHLSPHSFRHAFATHCYENGMDLFTLKHLLGHQFLQTTEVYVQTGMHIWRPEYLKCHVLCADGRASAIRSATLGYTIGARSRVPAR